MLGVSSNPIGSPTLSRRRSVNVDDDADQKRNSLNNTDSSTSRRSSFSNTSPPASNRTNGIVTLNFSIPLMLLRCRLLYLFIQLLCDITNRYLPHPNKSDIMSIQISQSIEQLSVNNSNSSGEQTNELQLPTKASHSRSNSISSDTLSQIGINEGEVDGRVFGCLLVTQFTHLLETAESISEFAHTFNSEVALRKKLYAAGFVMNEQHGRLPQLFALEAVANREIWLTLYSYVMQSNQLSSIENTNALNTPKASVNHQQIQNDNPATPNTTETSSSTNELNEHQKLMKDCTSQLQNLTERLVIDYVSKTSAGQFVSLEHMEEVLETIIDAIGNAPLSYFAENLQSFYHVFLPLIEFGSPQTRSALSRLLGGSVHQLVQMGANSL
jgi:hypothetical protein